MIRRFPVIPTLLVLAAVAVMIALGFWQLDRREEKHLLLAHYADAANTSAQVDWPRSDDQAVERLYRHARIECLAVEGVSAIAGNSADGKSGVAITADCRSENGNSALVVLGWSRQPVTPDWTGGTVTGVIAPGPRLIATPPLAGLEANAIPDPSDIPDNHLAYAVQWFLFAAVALVIYALALRKRLAARPAQG